MEFYKLLDNYTHLLIHEPDAIVLTDELDSWCLQEIDFIGAPWFEGFSSAQYKHDANPVGVGNFGLSLIRVAAVQDVLRSKNRRYTFQSDLHRFSQRAPRSSVCSSEELTGARALSRQLRHFLVLYSA